MFRSMTPDQRYWRLLSLIEDFYSGGERTAEDPPPVRFPRPVAEREPGRRDRSTRTAWRR